MKYGILLFATAFFFSPLLFAFIPGDSVTLPEQSAATWSNCSPMPFGALTDKEKRKLPPFRAVVFFRSRAENTDVMLTMIEQLHRQNSPILLIAAITPDPISEVKKWQSAHPDYRVRMGADKGQKITHAFMAGVTLFPMAFLLDEDGVILWRGEAVDLGEAFLQAKNGTLNRDIQRKTAPMISELLQQLRSGDDAAIYQTSKRILSVDPGNATTLRIQLFLLENKGKYPEAKALIWEQIQKAPTLLRLYFTLLDLMRRRPELRGDLAQVADKFFASAVLPEEVIGFARCLLEYFPDSPEALAAAAKLLASVKEDLPSSLRPLYLTVSASLAYRLCDLPRAISLQQQAWEEYRKSERQDAADDAEKRLLFYRKIQELRDQQFPAK